MEGSMRCERFLNTAELEGVNVWHYDGTEPLGHEPFKHLIQSSSQGNWSKIAVNGLEIFASSKVILRISTVMGRILG